MNRREFVQAGAATLAAGALAHPALANIAMAPTGKKLKVDTYSRHLQWLRSADEVAEAAIEMGFDGVDLTVRPYPGHVDPEKVETDLPPFVNAIRKHGLQVVTITSPITDAASPNVEKILGTASQLGITHYWWGTFRYDQTKPVMPQLEALKPRVEGLAKLGEKHKMKAMYHTYSGNAMVGAAIWDLLSVLKNFDPAYVGFHYDVGHMTNAGGNGTWELNLRAAGPYIAGISAKDSIFELNLANLQGGAYTGTPEQLNSRSFGPPPSAGAAPARGGAGAPVAGPGTTPGAGSPAPGSPGARAAAGPGRPAAGAPGGLGGRGPGGPGGATPGRGGGGQPNPWRVRQVPLGEGMDDLPALAAILKEIAFEGPIEVQAEYPNGGAESAQDKITLPRAMVLGAMKRDRLTLKAAFTESGLL